MITGELDRVPGSRAPRVLLTPDAWRQLGAVDGERVIVTSRDEVLVGEVVRPTIGAHYVQLFAAPEGDPSRCRVRRRLPDTRS